MGTTGQFNTEGLELRFKQKVVAETAPQSISNEIDFTKNAKIFLHENGTLYFQDGNIVDPISLNKLKEYYDYIKVVNGELRFFKSDMSVDVPLSLFTKPQPSISNANCVTFSKSKKINIEKYDLFEEMYKEYDRYSKVVDSSTSIPISATEMPDYNALKALEVNVMDKCYLALTENNVFNQLILNYTSGITWGELAVYPNDFATISGNYEDSDVILTDKSSMFTSEVIGFSPTLGDNPNIFYIQDKPVLDFYDYILNKLYFHNDIGIYVDLFLNSIEIDDYYFNTNKAFFIKEFSNIVSTVVIPNFSNKIIFTLSESSLINEDTNTFRSASEIKQNINIEDIINVTLFVENSNISQMLTDILRIKNSSVYNPPHKMIDVINGYALTSGGKFNPENFYDADLSIFNNVWFDVPDMYIVTNKVTNTVGVSVFASLNVEIKHKQNVFYEFRLIDTVSNVQLDNVIIETVNYNNLSHVGNNLIERMETYPIQLSYIGPIPAISCSRKTYESCLLETDVKSYITINTDNLNSNSKVDEAYTVITNRINTLSKQVEPNLNDIQLSAPRIFRVQWRATMVEDIYVNPLIESLGSVSFNKYTDNDEFEMNVNVYEFGGVTNKKIVGQGIVQFKNEKRKRVEISYINSSSANDYSISLSSNKNIKLWHDDKNKNGFSIVANKEFTGEVSWSVARQSALNVSSEKIDNSIPTCLVDSLYMFSNLSNFDIFTLEGYNPTLSKETIVTKISGGGDIIPIVIPPKQKITVHDTGEEPPVISGGAPISGSNLDIYAYDIGYMVQIPGNFVGATLGDFDNGVVDIVGTVVAISANSITVWHNGHDCYNYGQPDCPKGQICSGGCPNVGESGCGCCDCYDDVQCPDGQRCYAGTCVPMYIGDDQITIN